MKKYLSFGITSIISPLLTFPLTWFLLYLSPKSNDIGITSGMIGTIIGLFVLTWYPIFIGTAFGVVSVVTERETKRYLGIIGLIINLLVFINIIFPFWNNPLSPMG